MSSNTLATQYQATQHQEKGVCTVTKATIKPLIESLKTQPHEFFDLFCEQPPTIQLETIHDLTALATTRHRDNALLLFKAILEQDDKRTALFEQGLSALTNCFAHHDACIFFTDYLYHYHEKSWFAQGLKLFAKTQNNHDKRARLLLDALDNSKDQHTFITRLLATETTTSILLNEFLFDDNNLSIQLAHNSYIDAFTAYFLISHITYLIQSLPKNSPWFARSQYRLILMAFLTQSERLFPKRKLQLSEQYAWNANDLIALTHFTKQHLIEGITIDESLDLGQKLLTELSFRTATIGQTNLFYKHEKFDIKLACRWIIDWKKVTGCTWNLDNSNSLPLITFFLLHYVGTTDNVKQLIEDILDACIQINNTTLIHHMTHILHIAPDTDIASLIFSCVHARVVHDSSLLSPDILNDLSYFYCKKEQSNDSLALIKSFGQQKQYLAVLKLCQLLEPSQHHAQLVNHIKKEAHVELMLSSLMKKWYFPLAAFLMRHWHYAGKKPSTYVVYCNSTQTSTTTCPAVWFRSLA